MASGAGPLTRRFVIPRATLAQVFRAEIPVLPFFYALAPTKNFFSVRRPSGKGTPISLDARTDPPVQRSILRQSHEIFTTDVFLTSGSPAERIAHETEHKLDDDYVVGEGILTSTSTATRSP